MMFDVHPLHPSRPSPSQKLNRENRIKNACLSNSHSNIMPSNDKRPLSVQIPATPSASLVSTSLPVQCLRSSNFFFFRGIFPNSFLCDQVHRNRMKHSFYTQVRRNRMKHSFLRQINKCVDWRGIRTLLNKKYTKTQNAVGNPAYDAFMMFKILLLQTWYGLSDYEVEDEL